MSENAISYFPISMADRDGRRVFLVRVEDGQVVDRSPGFYAFGVWRTREAPISFEPTHFTPSPR